MSQQTFDVPAKVLWFSTGIFVGNVSGTTITADPNGRWTANPANGPYDAKGINIPGKTSYCLPNAPEGSLVAMSKDTNGNSEVIEVGLGITHQFKNGGNLYLSINDDTAHLFGRGFDDNNGSIHVTVTY